jgi:hypothetical protein
MSSLTDDLEDMVHHYEAKTEELREEIAQRQKELERIEDRLTHARETLIMLTEWRVPQAVSGQLPGERLRDPPTVTATAAPDQPGTPPTLQQIILYLLEAHGDVMSPAEMYEACQRRGWTVKRNSVGATLSKLVHAQRLVRVRDGQYSLPTQ